MRKTRPSFAAVGLVVTMILGPATGAFGAPYSPPAPAPPGILRTNGTDWAGHGALAFVSRGQLFRLNASGHLVELSGPPMSGFDSNPEWSADGKWLAFLHTGPASGFDVPRASLWLTASNSNVAHRVTSLPVEEFRWAPASDTLAYLSFAGSSFSGALWEVRAGSDHHTRPISNDVTSFLWTPSGGAVAVVHESGAGDSFRTSLAVVPTGRGGATTWWTTSTIECVTFASYDPNGTAIAAWVDQGCDDDADGEPVEIFEDGRPPVTVGDSLIDMSSLSWSPKGDELAIVRPGDRTIWGSDKDVSLCGVAPVRCRALTIPSGMVGLAPAWTPSATLYFVVASGSGPFSTNGVAYYSPGWIAKWQSTHTAWILKPHEQQPEPVEPSLGTVLDYDAASASNALLFVRNDAIYLLSHQGGVAVRIAGPLLSQMAPSGYYGLTDWGALFSWSEASEPSEVLSQASAALPYALEQVPNPPSTR